MVVSLDKTLGAPPSAPTVSITPEPVPSQAKLLECEVPPTAKLEELRAGYDQLSQRLHEVTKNGMNTWSGVIAEAAGARITVPDIAKDTLKAQYRAAYGLPADHEIELTVRLDSDSAVFGPADVKHGRMLAAYELGQNSVQKVNNSVTVRSLGIDSCVDDLKR